MTGRLRNLLPFWSRRGQPTLACGCPDDGRPVYYCLRCGTSRCEVHWENAHVCPISKEWDAAVGRALAKLGLTYEQLADMARRDDFVSVEARKLWVSIGGTPPALPSVPDEHAALVRELVAVTEELDEERRRSAAFAVRVIKLRARLHMSPDEAHRNCLVLQDRLDELRRDYGDLERRHAELRRAAAVYGLGMDGPS